MTQYKLLNNGLKKKKNKKNKQLSQPRVNTFGYVDTRIGPLLTPQHTASQEMLISRHPEGGSRFQEASAPRFLKSCGSPGPRAPAGPEDKVSRS